MAKNYPLRIEAGATYTRQFRLTNKDDGSLYDFTGYTAKTQIREYPSTALALEVTTTIDVPTAVITITITAVQSATLTDQKYFWGMEVSAAGGEPTIRLVEGEVSVTPQVVY
jgi:hypothetical protein